MEKKDASEEVKTKDPVIRKLIKKGVIAEDEKVFILLDRSGGIG